MLKKLTTILLPLFSTHVSGLSILLFAQCLFAQSLSTMKRQECGVELIKLSPPVYSPLARQARISGDVVIQLAVGPNGEIESANVVSGHPILKQGALESAQKSIFECRCCRENSAPYSLIYTFGFRDDGRGCGVKSTREWHVRSLKCLYVWKCKVLRDFTIRPWSPNPEIKQSDNHVTVTALPVCVQTKEE